MIYLVTFLEGVITFVSPCLLPMLPIYLAYFAGGTIASGKGASARTFICALSFVLGFGVVFVCMGAFVGTLGSVFTSHQRVLDVICGMLVILLGLGYLDVLRLPQLDLGGAGRFVSAPRGPVGSFMFGLVFAIAWTPCVGTFLASALSMAASSASAVEGVVLLLCFTAGLGVPFVLCALLVDQIEGATKWVKQHYALVNRISGSLLVAVGILMATGTLGTMLRLLA